MAALQKHAYVLVVCAVVKETDADRCGYVHNAPESASVLATFRPLAALRFPSFEALESLPELMGVA